MDTKTCVCCGVSKPIEKFKLAWGREGCRRNRCSACDSRRERANIKLDMLKAFGAKCSCCGEDNPYFLSLDHVQNDGAHERNRLGYGEVQIYRKARREGWPRDRYACLCMNCNFAKGHFGFCPHTKGITSAMAMRALEQEATKIGNQFINYEGSKRGWFQKGHAKHQHGSA